MAVRGQRCAFGATEIALAAAAVDFGVAIQRSCQ